MKLYYSPGACSLAPHMVLHESGLPFEAVRTDTRTKALADGGEGAYFNINPLGYVPLLALGDGTRITEVGAIVQYVADRVPDKKLAPPAGTIERTRLHSWLSFISSELHKSCSPLFVPTMPDEGKQYYRDRLANRLAHVEKHLAAGNDYLLGKDFSVADAYLFAITNWAGRLNIDLAPYPALLAYRQRMAQRPAVVAAMTAEGLIK
jgi:glutathione S-transferase